VRQTDIRNGLPRLFSLASLHIYQLLHQLEFYLLSLPSALISSAFVVVVFALCFDTTLVADRNQMNYRIGRMEFVLGGIFAIGKNCYSTYFNIYLYCLTYSCMFCCSCSDGSIKYDEVKRHHFVFRFKRMEPCPCLCNGRLHCNGRSIFLLLSKVVGIHPSSSTVVGSTSALYRYRLEVGNGFDSLWYWLGPGWRLSWPRYCQLFG
jgi:hypothetical protein